MLIFDSVDDEVCCETCRRYQSNGEMSYCGADGHHIGKIGAICDCCAEWKEKEKDG